VLKTARFIKSGEGDTKQLRGHDPPLNGRTAAARGRVIERGAASGIACVCESNRVTVAVMSVAELIKKVKALPAREREKVFLAILALDEETLPARSKQTKRVAWPDVEARAKRIFGDRVLPNLVLLEREENPF
jgi:23S rRNA A1618 N6-methylase RlmF